MSVLSHLRNKASSLVLSDNERTSINNSIATLKTRLNEYFGTEVIEQVKFGSSTRRTILPRWADERSDVDYMVVFDNSNDLRPDTFITKLKRFAEAKYSRSEVHQSHPTVVLSLNHIKFELVPAYKNWYGTYQIPAPAKAWAEWVATYPNSFNKEVQDKNEGHNYEIKPLIRLVKYWNANSRYIYYSYELEKDIVNSSYWWCYNLKDYLFKYINGLSTWPLTQTNAAKVDRAKKIIAKVQEYEQNEMPASAEQEIKKLIP